jgi:hypothetical protein
VTVSAGTVLMDNLRDFNSSCCDRFRRVMFQPEFSSNGVRLGRQERMANWPTGPQLQIATVSELNAEDLRLLPLAEREISPGCVAVVMGTDLARSRYAKKRR